MNSSRRGGQAQLFEARPLPRAYKPKACKGCKVEFQPLSGNQSYCTRDCYDEHNATERICVQCGGSFSRPRFTPATRYCSWRCRDLHRFGEKLEVPCKGCGTLFVKRRENHQWCSQGCAKAARQRSRKSRGLHPGNWSLKLKGEAQCRNCGRDANHLHHIVPRSKSRLGRSDWSSMAVKRSILVRDITEIDLEITRLWRKYRVTNCSSAVLLAIDALLDQRHELINGGEMTNPLDIAPVSEYGPADLGDAA